MNRIARTVLVLMATLSIALAGASVTLAHHVTVPACEQVTFAATTIGWTAVVEPGDQLFGPFTHDGDSTFPIAAGSYTFQFRDSKGNDMEGGSFDVTQCASPSPSPSPSEEPSPSPSASPSPLPSPSPSPVVTSPPCTLANGCRINTPVPSPTPTPTPTPSVTPTPTPTAVPSVAPTSTPVAVAPPPKVTPPPTSTESVTLAGYAVNVGIAAILLFLIFAGAVVVFASLRFNGRTPRG